jgi:hypothetical protein
MLLLLCSYKGPQSAKPISIGKDCWLGGSVVVFGELSSIMHAHTNVRFPCT